VAGLIGLTAADIEIQDALGTSRWEYEDKWIPHPVVRLTTSLPIAINKPEGRTIVRARWGFDVGGGRPIGNARDDRLTESPMWKSMLGRKPALFVSTGIYEQVKAPKKTSYWFRRVDGKPIVMPGLSHWAHPKFFGYFPCNGELSSVLGDFASTGLGVLGLAWQSSPALTEVEEVATDWLRQMLGLPDGWSGVIQDTASTSTLVALLCARERVSHYSFARGGLQAEAAPLVVYASAHSHSSVEKAALLAGFGRDNLRRIDFDPTWAMVPAALNRAIDTDLAAGRVPCAVVVTTGTTTSTAIDPVAAIAAIAHERGLWLHVDAAMAGSAMILPECRWMWRGVEDADSLVVNPHKWLGAAFDCSVYFVRDPDSAPDRPVFNRTVGLRDTFAKEVGGTRNQ